jgi:hypothetical protein
VLTKIFRYVYLVLSWAFLVGVIVQVYTAGLSAVTSTLSWGTHAEFGFLLLLAGLLQLLLAWPARLPRPAGWINTGLFGVMLVQLAVFLNRDHPISALHPVLALVIFYMAWWLALAAYRTVRDESRLEKRNA